MLLCTVAFGQRPKREVDLGVIAHKSTKDTVLHVHSLNGPMWVDQVKLSCSCIKVKHSRKAVMAHDSVALHVRFSADDKGVFYKTMRVICSDENATHDIVIRGRVK